VDLLQFNKTVYGFTICTPVYLDCKVNLDNVTGSYPPLLLQQGQLLLPTAGRQLVVGRFIVMSLYHGMCTVHFFQLCKIETVSRMDYAYYFKTVIR
jgi:hypothetical protein